MLKLSDLAFREENMLRERDKARVCEVSSMLCDSAAICRSPSVTHFPDCPASQVLREGAWSCKRRLQVNAVDIMSDGATNAHTPSGACAASRRFSQGGQSSVPVPAVEMSLMMWTLGRGKGRRQRVLGESSVTSDTEVRTGPSPLPSWLVRR